MYNEHCRGLDGPLKDHISTTYGISKKSILNDLQHYHVVTGVVPDIMHNILEGNGAMVTMLFTMPWWRGSLQPPCSFVKCNYNVPSLLLSTMGLRLIDFHLMSTCDNAHKVSHVYYSFLLV